MITVRDLAKKLSAYPDQNTEVMIADATEGVAFSFLRGDDNSAMGMDSVKVERFLVFMPDVKGKRLVLKGMG